MLHEQKYLWIMEKETATHSSILAWRILWMEESGGLPFIRSHRVRHDCSDLACMHWRRKWHPLQCSCLENPRDRGAWWAAIYGVTQSWTRLKRLSMHALEKEMATHSSILAWSIPGMEEPGGLLSMGLHRVGHECSDLAAAAASRNI